MSSNGRSVTILIAAAGLLMGTLAGCGDSSTGPEQGEGDWQEYSTGDFLFEWQFEDSPASLRLRLTAPTTGWVSVGFDPTSMMEDADLLVGYVEAGTAYIRDDFGTGQFSHASDVSLGGTDDAELIEGSESSGETVLEFRIPQDSGDQYDKVYTQGTAYTLIFAYGEDGADDFTSYHAWAESASFEL